MHRITLPIPLGARGFRPLSGVVSITFSIALAAMPQVQIKRAATTLVSGDETVNPLMAYSVIGLFLLQSLRNLLRTHAMLQPNRKTLTEPYSGLAELARLRSPDITFLRCLIRFVGHLRAVAANFPANSLRTHIEPFGNAGLAFFAS